MWLLRVCLPRRLTPKKLMLAIFLIFILGWIAVLLLQSTPEGPNQHPGEHKQPEQPFHKAIPNIITQQSNKTLKHELGSKDKPQALKQRSKITPRALLNVAQQSQNNRSNFTSPVARFASITAPPALEQLRQKLLALNREEKVLNADKYTGVQELVVIVQAHERVGYLQQLLASLKEVKDVHKILLVVSHDYYSDDMNRAVESVDFCKVLQIFYPYSLQVFPDVFPGQSEKDCPRDTPRQRAIDLNCTNALHPDSYGHYREARVTAIKHHWWWKVNTVFDHLQITAKYNGYVLFLEEDHFVSPDFFHVTKKLIELKRDRCGDCDFINLGTYQKVKYAVTGKQAFTDNWNAGRNNMGFGMDRTVWNSIKSCCKNFCTYDDYNWDWSLNVLGGTCLGHKLKVLVAKAPRVLHIGTCGTHHHKSCNEVEQAKVARDKFTSESSHLFPERLDLVGSKLSSSKPAKNYGGWGDIRDHELCSSFVKV